MFGPSVCLEFSAEVLRLVLGTHPLYKVLCKSAQERKMCIKPVESSDRKKDKFAGQDDLFLASLYFYNEP